MVNPPALPMQLSEATPKISFATQFTLGMSPVEFILMLGNTRPLADPNGLFGSQALVEWTSIYSISPTAAKQLSLNLAKAVNDYEKSFGEIPLDPTIKSDFGL